MARFLIVLFFCTTAVRAHELGKTFEKAKFRIGKQDFEAYIADDDRKRAQGLMFVEAMEENVGMLFIFPDERPLSFWMKNTLIPLNIGFFDAKGKLVDAQEMKVAGTLLANEVPTYQSRRPALFALEMNRGWFEKHKIKIGAQLELRSSAQSSLLKSKLGARQ